MLPLLVWTSCLAFLSGFPIAWAWGKYMHHSRTFHENRAGLWDTVIVLLSNALALTLWKISGENIVVLLTYAVGNGLGTRLVVLHNRKAHERSTSDARHYM